MLFCDKKLLEFLIFRTDREPLLGSSGDHVFETMSMEIERLLSKVMVDRSCLVDNHKTTVVSCQ